MPGVTRCIYYLAEALVKMNLLPEALPYYDKLLKEFPKSDYRKKTEKQRWPS